MNHRQLLETARRELTGPQFDVWFAKHYHGYGRRAGSLALGISEEQFRYRLRRADLKMRPHLEQENAA